LIVRRLREEGQGAGLEGPFLVSGRVQGAEHDEDKVNEEPQLNILDRARRREICFLRADER